MSDTPDEVLTILPLIQRFVGNQPDALEQIRAQVQNELHFAEMNVQRAKEQLAAVEWVIANMETATADVTPNGSAPAAIKPLNAPPLRRAIEIVLGEQADYMARDEIIAELDRRGWAPGGKTPRNTVISRLSEMRKAGVIERSGKTNYRLAEVETEASQQRLP